jgi:ubiquinone/menaquinone biosynthesis C-methylase UbiE
MSIDLTEYRLSDLERQRTGDLMRLAGLVANSRGAALDIGARDGHFSCLLAEHFRSVTALDLDKPSVRHAGVHCVEGDITSPDFGDNSFDFILCAEVLEHIPPDLLQRACFELSRVCREYLLVGVPYKQELRSERTTCFTCGKKNPPWGHVNRFDQQQLIALFPVLNACEVSFVGETNTCANLASTLLMDLAGNPYGTYMQEEPCVHCGSKLKIPPERTLMQKVLTRAAYWARDIQKPFSKPHPKWIHVLFKK